MLLIKLHISSLSTEMRLGYFFIASVPASARGGLCLALLGPSDADFPAGVQGSGLDCGYPASAPSGTRSSSPKATAQPTCCCVNDVSLLLGVRGAAYVLLGERCLLTPGCTWRSLRAAV
jgi:hypothetical protein